MRFIIKDEPAGWAVSVWVMDDRPQGWNLMQADSVMPDGEIVWRWVPVIEGAVLPTPTMRFNWDFVEELANALLKRVPKKVDDALLETLKVERERVDKMINYLTHCDIAGSMNAPKLLAPMKGQALEYLEHLMFQPQQVTPRPSLHQTKVNYWVTPKQFLKQLGMT